MTQKTECTTKERYANQLDIINPTFEQTSIVVIGAWGIGSTTVMCLAQMGIKDITVVDFDEVENHNLSSQLYKETDIGKPKVSALQENVKTFTGIDIKTINDRFTPDMVKDADIVIIGVDNMATRKEVAEACTTKTKRFIDGRMQGEAFELHMFIPKFELPLYMMTWYSDEEASHQLCTAKAVSYNTFAIASVISRLVVGIIKEDENILSRKNIQVDLHNLLLW